MKHDGYLTPEEMKDFIEQSLDADKAFEISTIDLRGQSAIADFMIIASGTSSRHVAALAEKLRDRLGARGTDNIRVEGLGHSDWVVVDAGDVLVHVFRPEVRAFYNIEKMWSAWNGMEIVGLEATA
ncbi:MAG: ribosome silencing factor [Alphaproteobacteria bacterium]